MTELIGHPELEPIQLTFDTAKHGKYLTPRGASDMLFITSTYGPPFNTNRLMGDYGPMNSVKMNLSGSQTNPLRWNADFYSDISDSEIRHCFVFNPSLKGGSVINAYNLTESLVGGPKSKTGRQFTQREVIHLGLNAGITAKMRKGYAVFPPLYTDRDNFEKGEGKIPPLTVTLLSAGETKTPDGRVGNFWNDSQLCSDHYIPVIAYVLKALYQGQPVEFTSSHPDRDAPLDTYSRLLVAQALQHLLLQPDGSVGDRLLGFSTDPILDTQFDLIFWNQTEDRPQYSGSRKRNPFVVRPKSFSYTVDDWEGFAPGIKLLIDDLKNTFLDNRSWVSALKHWQQEIAPKHLK